MFHQKVNVYKSFLDNNKLRRLIVCGNDDTGISITLKIACHETAAHSPLTLVYPNKPTVYIPMKDYTPSRKQMNLEYKCNDECDFNPKTIIHTYSFKKEDFNDETQIVVFTQSLPSNLTDTFHE